jgi:hypothetical protein
MLDLNKATHFFMAVEIGTFRTVPAGSLMNDTNA